MLALPRCEAGIIKMIELVTKGRFAHVLRMIVCVLSFGFAFPYSFMENVEAAKILAAEEKIASKK